jgi:hypothetical protein
MRIKRKAKQQQPPLFMGIIFIVMGLIPVLISKPSPGVPIWVGYVSALIFVSAGIGLCSQSLGDMKRASVAWSMSMLAFLTMFNWVAFGPGERIGRSGFSAGGVSVSQNGSDVRLPFMIATAAMDAIAVVVIIHKVKKGLARRKKDRMQNEKNEAERR